MAKSFYEAQIAALLAAGVDLVDAERTVGFVAKLDLRDAAKDTLPAEVVERLSEIKDSDVTDAQADWLASPAIPNRYRRILHAQAAQP